MQDHKNTIKIERKIDGWTIFAEAEYIPSEDGWECRVQEGRNGPADEVRGPDETGNDVWATLIDMIELAVEAADGREAMNAGPFSRDQCA